MESEDARKKLNFALDNIAAKQNVPIINKLSKMRQEAAQMLNYTSYAEMTLKPKMAHNVKNVEKLLDGITHRITDMGRKEH